MHGVLVNSISDFLSSANEVSTGPTCQFLFVCLSVCLCFHFFQGTLLDDILASDSVSGNILI